MHLSPTSKLGYLSFNDLGWNLTYYSRLALCMYIKKINIVYIFNLFSNIV